MTNETKQPITKEQIAEWQANKATYNLELSKLYEEKPELKEQFEKATEGVQHLNH